MTALCIEVITLPFVQWPTREGETFDGTAHLAAQQYFPCVRILCTTINTPLPKANTDLSTDVYVISFRFRGRLFPNVHTEIQIPAIQAEVRDVIPGLIKEQLSHKIMTNLLGGHNSDTLMMDYVGC
jgi:hypothetical protein